MSLADEWTRIQLQRMQQSQQPIPSLLPQDWSFNVQNPQHAQEEADLHKEILKHQLSAHKLADTQLELEQRSHQIDLRNKMKQYLTNMAPLPGFQPNKVDPDSGQPLGGPPNPNNPTDVQEPAPLAGTIPGQQIGDTSLPEEPVYRSYQGNIDAANEAQKQQAQQDAVTQKKALAQAETEGKAEGGQGQEPVEPQLAALMEKTLGFPAGSLSKSMAKDQLNRLSTLTGQKMTAQNKDSLSGLGLSGSEGGPVGSISPTTGRNDEFLQQLPSSVQGIIKGAADYTLDPTKITSLRGDQRMHLVEAIKQYDPSFDLSQYGARQKMRNSFIGDGNAAQNIRALNTAIAHLDTLQHDYPKLGNYQYPLLNGPKNMFNQTILGKWPVNTFNTDANAVADELGKVFKGAGTLPEAESQRWLKNISPDMSPEQMKASVEAAIKLLGGRVQALHDQYEKGMGRPRDFSMLTPTAQMILKKNGFDPNEIDPMAASPASLAPTPSGKEASQMNDEDAQAIEWAKANPSDPRAAKILQLHGQ